MSEEPISSLYSLIQTTDVLESEGNLEGAIKLLSDFLSNPANTNDLSQTDLINASTKLSRVKENRDRASALRNEAVSAEKAADFSLAESSWRELLRILPHNDEAKGRLEILPEKRKHTESIRLKLTIEDALKNGQGRLAAECLGQYRHMNPSDLWAIEILPTVEAAKQREERSQLEDKVKEALSRNRFHQVVNIGEELKRMGWLEGHLLQIYQHAQSKLSELEALRKRGSELYTLGDLKSALRCYDEAQLIDNDDPTISEQGSRIRKIISLRESLKLALKERNKDREERVVHELTILNYEQNEIHEILRASNRQRLRNLRLIIFTVLVVTVIGAGVYWSNRDVRTGGSTNYRVVESITNEDASSASSYRTNSIGMKFRLIEPGTFLLGSNDGDGDETPIHEVVIEKPFYIGVYEVTQSQWETIMNRNPSKFQGPNQPVTNVSWNECQEFIRILSMKEDSKYRLPSEAEWEYACRAGSHSRFSFGDEEDKYHEFAWFKENSGNQPQPVGRKRSNAWGLHDMHGNVWEWCQDWYTPYPGNNYSNKDYGTNHKVLRGGSWFNSVSTTRASDRISRVPTYKISDFGVRLAADSVGFHHATTKPQNLTPTSIGPSSTSILKNADQVSTSGSTLGSNSNDWSSFLGPNQNLISNESDWNQDWQKNPPKQVWKKSVGTGFSGISVSGGRVYTVGNAKDTDTIWCFSSDTGEVFWSHSIPVPIHANQYEGGPGSTPTVDNDLVFYLSKVGDLICLDSQLGAVRWQKDLKKEFGVEPPKWFFAGSPVIDGDSLYLDVGKVICLDKRTGRSNWQTKDFGSSYSTPIRFDHGGRSWLAAVPAKGLVIFDSTSGNDVSLVPWTTKWDMHAPSPVWIDGKIFLSSGYHTGSALFSVSDEGKLTQLWKKAELWNHIPTSIHWNGYIYGLSGWGDKEDCHLFCIESQTGDLKWSNPTIKKGSMILVDGKLVILTEKGELILAEANPDRFVEISRFHALGGKCWTIPTLAGGRIYLRNAKGDLVCYDLRNR